MNLMSLHVHAFGILIHSGSNASFVFIFSLLIFFPPFLFQLVKDCAVCCCGDGGIEISRGAIGSDTDRILPLPYPYPHPTFGYGYGYEYWRMWKNDIRIRQNQISDINRILADRMRILIGYVKSGYG